MSVKRIYVEKATEYAVEAKGILDEIHSLLQITSVKALRFLNRYDVEGIDDELFNRCRNTVFSEPQIDITYDELPKGDYTVFATEYLPGQFDQRADSCSQCIQIVSEGERPLVRTAKIYMLEGDITPEELEKIKSYVVNPVESRLASLENVDTLNVEYEIPTTVETLDGFLKLNDEELADFVVKYNLAMDRDDIKFCQDYFKSENKEPTITEIRMIDTYWSDHCRHTTFLTQIDDVKIDDEVVKKAFDKYLETRGKLNRKKPMTLMDIGTIGAKELIREGKLCDLDESEEINACTVKIDVDVDGENQKWLFLFKNETHNHPTEIEPFGGAATCIGGAIRDPLSGRSYVYQAMRVTGAANPLVSVEETMRGKLPQRKLVRTAAAGYSSYGNQIGLATGQVDEIYHDGYVAKRMEIGAVVGATPAENVRREAPVAGDIVILLGGRTGRDGCGGATGSSKAHKLDSIQKCGAEVQKGNAPEERKLQRLFRNSEVTKLIKRCNDFGAGGVSVAIGELADGLLINLNAVPKKYDGLDGTELAISESQERMAVVVAKEDVDKFIELASRENLEATVVAEVTDEPRLRMVWNDKEIVNIKREFLNSNGATKHTTVVVPKRVFKDKVAKGASIKEKFENLVGDLNICSKKGLSERFDSTIGAGTVVMPFGGKHQLTPAQAMVAKMPVLNAETKTCSVMGYGYNPFITSESMYHGAYLAVVESIAKVVATGGTYKKCWLTFQEYFERLGNSPERWGKPFSALLGALKAQLDFGIASIGGKDSMSGSFEDIDVPPTLVSFAVSISNTDNIITPEFKCANSKIALILPQKNADGLCDVDEYIRVFDTIETLIKEKKVKAVSTITYGGIAEALFKMSIGNGIGVDINLDEDTLFNYNYGGFVVELAEDVASARVIGETTQEYSISVNGEKLDLANLQNIYEDKLEPIFPYRTKITDEVVETIGFDAHERIMSSVKVARPRVLIPVFPGTNCEYDTAHAFIREGAETKILVLKNLSASDITESVNALVREIEASNIIALPGGFSGGDEPDGSGKFITAFFRNPAVMDSVHNLLNNRDGLMCGICNGFQALIKLGLVPFGKIVDTDVNSPTLTFNTIGRHQSSLVRTRVASNKSPWMMYNNVGDIHTVAISHGEGRFIANDDVLRSMIAKGQIATQYVDLSGKPSMDIRYNPNESVLAIEGITSPDGRVFGKMGHSERKGDNLYKNVDGIFENNMFRGAVDYFTK